MRYVALLPLMDERMRRQWAAVGLPQSLGGGRVERAIVEAAKLVTRSARPVRLRVRNGARQASRSFGTQQESIDTSGTINHGSWQTFSMLVQIEPSLGWIGGTVWSKPFGSTSQIWHIACPI